jgi:hypothetical protein
MPATSRRACKRMQHCGRHENCRDHRCFERSQNYDLIQLHHGRVAPVGVKEVTWEADSADTLKGGHRTPARISESASRLASGFWFWQGGYRTRARISESASLACQPLLGVHSLGCSVPWKITRPSSQTPRRARRTSMPYSGRSKYTPKCLLLSEIAGLGLPSKLSVFQFRALLSGSLKGAKHWLR